MPWGKPGDCDQARRHLCGARPRESQVLDLNLRRTARERNRTVGPIVSGARGAISANFSLGPAILTDQSAGVTVMSLKYIRLSAFDHSPIRPETGSGNWCSR